MTSCGNMKKCTTWVAKTWEILGLEAAMAVCSTFIRSVVCELRSAIYIIINNVQKLCDTGAF